MITGIKIQNYLVQELVSEYANAVTALRFANDEGDKDGAKFWAGELRKIQREATRRKVWELVSEYSLFMLELWGLRYSNADDRHERGEKVAEKMTAIIYQAKDLDYAAIRNGFDAGKRMVIA